MSPTRGAEGRLRAWPRLRQLLDPDFDLPASGEVVLVKEPLHWPKLESRQRHRGGILVEIQPAGICDAVIVALDAEAMQVIAIPAHEKLDHLVQVGD